MSLGYDAPTAPVSPWRPLRRVHAKRRRCMADDFAQQQSHACRSDPNDLMLPFFLLGLPAGRFDRDIVDRRSLILRTELWVLGVVAVLAALTLGHG
jgi:hypothetical protein